MKLRKVRIDQIGRVVTGHTPLKKKKEYFGDDFTWIKPTDIEKDKRYVSKTSEKYSQKAYEKYSQSILPPLSTCVTTIGTVGEKICLTKEPSFTNQSINAIIPNKDEFDPMFVFYLLKHNLNVIALRNPGTSSGRHHISKSNFSSIELEVPDLASQKIIAWIISSYDDLIENYSRQNKILEEIIELVYNKWFINSKTPKNWKIGNLGNLVDLISGFAFKSKEYVSDKKGVRLARGDNIKRENFAWGDKTRYWKEITPNLKKYELQQGDILIGMDGSRVGENYTMVEYYDLPILLVQRVARLRSKADYYSEYVWQSIKGGKFTKYIKNIQTGSAIPHVSQKQINDFEILLPPLEYIKKFQILSLPLRKKISKNKHQILNLKETRDILLQKFLSGENNVMELEIKISKMEQ